MKKGYDTIKDISDIMKDDDIPDLPESFIKLSEAVQYGLILYALAKVNAKSNWSALASIVGLILTILSLIFFTEGI